MLRRFSAIPGTLLLAAVLSGQTFTGNITGAVTDPNSAAVPSAAITLTNLSTGEVRTGSSSETGLYSFSQLLPGSYSLKAGKAGFKEYVRTGIELSASQTADIPVKLVLGSVNEIVEVTAEAPLVDSQTANQITTLSTQMVEELPNSNLNPFSLVYSMAGVSSISEGTGLMDQNATRLAINGGRENTAQVLVDGIPAAAGDWGGLIATPGMGSVAEFQVTRNSYDAQFGRSGGGVISVTTRGGSSKFHGTAFDNLQNDNLNANGFFNNLNGASKLESKRNLFGGTINGPIWNRRRLTGMFGYEGIRHSNPANRTATLPTELERAGDFSNTRNANGTLRTIYDPMALTPDPARAGQFLRTPFAGNRIPTARMDPAGRAMMDLLVPLANRPGTGPAQTSNFFGQAAAITNTNRYDARVDWAHTASHTLYAQLTVARQRNDQANIFDPLAEVNYNAINPRFQVKVGNNFIISPRFVANVLLGAARWTEMQRSKGYGFDYARIGLTPAIAAQIDVETSPELRLNGLNNAIFGNPRFLSYSRMNDSVQLNFTREMNSHSAKFGWSFDASLQNARDAYSAYYVFDQYFTSGPSWDSRVASAGYAAASLLLGTGASGHAPYAARPATADKSWALYFQDGWRVNRRLTVNAGVRYEVQLARTERFNRINYFDPEAVNPIGAKAGLPDLKGALRFADEENRTPWRTSYHDFAPRLGIAYRLSPRAVVRAGYGIYFFRSVATGAKQSSLGYSNDTAWVSTTDGGRTPFLLASNPYPNGIAHEVGRALGPLTGVGASVVAFVQHRPTPYVQQYSFDMQFEIGRAMMAELGYSGSQGRKLGYGFNFRLNQLADPYLELKERLRDQVPNPFYGAATTGVLAASPTVERRNLLRPYPQFGNVDLPDQPGAGSSFNALNAGLTRRFSKSMTLMVSYRFSKAIDNASETISFGTNDRGRDFNNMRLDRSLSSHDIPHSLAVTYLYALPFGRGQRFGRALPGVLDHIVGGWRLSGVYKLDSGSTMNFDAADNTFSLGGSQYPNISDRKLLPVESPDRLKWFNTEPFSEAAAYTFGSAPRWVGEVRSGRNNIWNAGMMKHFNLRESVRLQARADMFNAVNHTRFGMPVTQVTAGNFGAVTAVKGSPRVVQAGLKLMF